MEETTDGTKPITYADSVNYAGGIDAFKRACLQAALASLKNTERLGVEVEGWSLGESAAVIDAPHAHRITAVNEGLGTKNLVADLMYPAHWRAIAQDTVAMIVNDLITVGSLPVCVHMHLAVEQNDWFDNADRSRALIEGWAEACARSGSAWGGGETPALRDIIVPGASLLAGSAVGVIREKHHVIRDAAITPGDSIVCIRSSGIHANGISLPRRSIAPKLPQGFHTKIGTGDLAPTFGHVMLRPTELYVKVIEACQDEDIPIHYAINVTGHGWAKFMRARPPFTYVMDEIPVGRARNDVFDFIQAQGPVELREMYKTFNMGVGFALVVAPRDAHRAVSVCRRLHTEAWELGHVEPGPKRVIIKPLGITFEAAELDIR